MNTDELHGGAPSAEDTLRAVERLYEESRYHHALAAAAPLGAPREWPGTEGRILAARMAYRLGAPRLAQALCFAAHRGAPRHAEAAYYYALLVYERRGPWHALRWLRSLGRVEGSDGVRALVLAVEARALGDLRDFPRAHERLDAAHALAPASPYLACELAHVLEREDRVEDAIDAAKLAIERRGGYRPATMILAHLYAARGESDRALVLLEGAEHAAQCWEILSQRAQLLFDLGRHEDALRDLDAATRAARWMERHVERHLASRRAECTYLMREHRRAAELARRVGTPFATRFAEALDQLEDGTPPPRVELPVPHVRQHYVTCAPASMASVSTYFGRPVDQLEVAEEICYGGTPDHLQRRWAEREGWIVRELDVTFDAVRALIDRGIPLLLGTASSVSAHLQVVVGYDTARRTLLIRDPSVPSRIELPIEELLEAQAWYGPPAKILLPKERASDLDGVELPAEALWDRRFSLVSALERHDPDAAGRELDAMRALAPEHRLTIEAELSLAAYRGEVDTRLECYERLLALFPETASFVLRRGELMRGRRARAEQLAYWRRYAHLDHPPLLGALAEELRHEGAHQEEAARLLRRALRLDPTSGFTHHVLADLEASRARSHEDTLESYRFAVCLAEHDEHFARAYYDAAREHGREEEALALLERRVERAGARSSEPAKTLFAVYRERGNVERGIEVLTRLARERPDDGELAIEIVHAHLAAGDVGAAQEALTASAPLHARTVDRGLAEARIARTRGRLEEARAILEDAVSEAPRRLDSVLALVDLLDELEGEEAALARLEQAREASPHERPLLHELIARVGARDSGRAIALLEEQLRDHPEDQWARRELALRHGALGELERGVEVAREAVRFLPHDSYAHGVLGRLLAFAGQREEARRELRQAIELDLENVGAMHSLPEAAGGPEELREDARFVLGLLLERVSHGSGLIEAAYLASCLPHEERIERLRRVLERVPRRPDGWEAVVRACLDADDLDEAEELVLEATERFPHWVHLHLMRAEVARARGDHEAQEASLRHAIERAPTWPGPAAMLARSLRERGETDGALSVLDEALARMPRAVALRTEHATLLWARGDREAAFEALARAVRETFHDDAAFRRLWAWSEHLGRAAELESLVRDQVAAQDSACLPRFRLALVLKGDERLEERLALLREALRRNPRHLESADLLAELLTHAARFEEAIAACPPAEWRGPAPTPIHGRRAWVLAQAGRMDEAIGAMESLLESDPGYSWGRRSIADWLDQRQDDEGFLRHARLLVEHQPLLGANHVYLGDALALSGEAQQARDAFARAIELAPEHVYATTRFLELELAEGGDPIDALERARHVLPPSTLESLRVRVHAARERDDEALDAFERLLEVPAPQAELEGALEAIASGPLAEGAFSLCEARLTDPDPPAGLALGYAWANVRERVRERGALRILKLRERLGPAGVAAVAQWIEVLAVRRRWGTLFWMWLRHRAWILRHDETWGSFGYALLAANLARSCARWLASFRDRAGARPWMLLNLVCALWIAHRGRGAREISERALSLPPDDASRRHRFWLAFEAAREKALDDAREHLALAGEPEKDTADAGLVRLVTALEAAASVHPSAPLSERTAAVNEALHDAAALARRCSDLRAPYDLTIDSIYADRNPFVRFWYRAFRLPSYHG